ncbi:21476_t:CDS:1 [Gigaspora margarita]|uniref:21476_t:CDS:1 n=1 Tax=Gigaspora margarita TaxID=4874 RepID=A0ABN7UWR3_GIGMA|nr:21476_t:CDS:1 [Gigaspora margarita]
MSIIVIGNFNANPNTPHSRRTTPILHQMLTLQLISLMQYFNVTQHTWARHNQSSQLDDFWTTPNIITNCPGINISTSTGSTDSDHAILVTTTSPYYMEQKENSQEEIPIP